MDGLSVVEPRRVHAVVVGVERYEKCPAWSLPGAVGDAVRFARWLRKGGVPAANIHLLLAPGEESRRLLDEVSQTDEIDWCEVSSRDGLMDAFTSGLDQRAGDLLYVYWGSHGVLDHGERRLLLCPDASLKDKRCIDTDNLTEHLARADLHGFAQQVLLFDACATFLEHHQDPVGPAVAAFPTAPRRGVEQFRLCAAAAGQVAENDPARRSGVFSRAVLDWLEAHAADLRPDLGSLEEHVKTWFGELHRAGGPLQTPVRLFIRTLDGSEHQCAEPALPPLPESADRGLVALALRSALGDPELRARCLDHLTSACPQIRLGPCPSDERIAHVLLTAKRAMAALVEVVCQQNRQAADEFLMLARSLGAPGLLSPLEHASLRELLERTPGLPPMAQVIDAVRTSLPLGRAWLPPHEPDGPTVGQLMACVEHFEEHAGGLSVAHPGRHLVPAVVRFTELLAAALPEARRELREWGDRVARRLGVDPGGLAERRADAEAWAAGLGPEERPPRVVAQLDVHTPGRSAAGAGEGGQSFTCVLWIDTGTGDLVRAADQGPAPLPPRDVVRLIERAVFELRAVTRQTAVVEILVQPDALHLPVDSWNGSEDTDPLPSLLGVERATVLRCAPLAPEREKQRRAGLQRRWFGRHSDKVVHLDDRHTEGHAGYGALMQDVGAARAVVRAAPGGRDRLVQTALLLGYPVVLWDRQAAGPVPDSHFAPLRPEAAVDGLPWRVRDYRAKACTDPVAHPARPAVLLEAADRPLPPVLSLTELSDAPPDAVSDALSDPEEVNS
ncbi:caspase family protein [Streptomyces incarnatus]|uniref:VMAP-C domain-containing protein n=1 Tax=Streptomyces incarnatus TaxID=665007 RepID=UPI000AEB27B2|nr:caspase family protein [Streptomyces incarnatus]